MGEISYDIANEADIADLVKLLATLFGIEKDVALELPGLGAFGRLRDDLIEHRQCTFKITLPCVAMMFAPGLIVSVPWPPRFVAPPLMVTVAGVEPCAVRVAAVAPCKSSPEEPPPLTAAALSRS